MTDLRVPVMVITGAVGVGKTTVAYEVRLRLRDSGVPHVLLDDEFGLFQPYPPDDPDGEKIRTEALGALWSVYNRVGVERLVLARLSKTRVTSRRFAMQFPAQTFRSTCWLPRSTRSGSASTGGTCPQRVTGAFSELHR
jgi:hypothetical protein